MLQIIKKSDYQVMPWKNGKGITSQIEIVPFAALFPSQDFLWRISSATVSDSGPFSQFPGFDRYLAILQGDGLNLNDKILRPKDVIHFNGEEQIVGTLIGQTVLDLGIIFRRDLVVASMKFIEVQKHQCQEIDLSHDVSYFFCAQGSMAVSDKTVYTGDCLKVQGVSKLNLSPRNNISLQIFLIGVSMKT